MTGLVIGHQRTFKLPNVIPFTKRNSQTILNTAFNGIGVHGNYAPSKAPMFWDVRSLSLELQVFEPIKSFEGMLGHSAPTDSVLDVIIKRLRSIPEYQLQLLIWGKQLHRLKDPF